jgi:DNA-binding NtrC family response regulator
VHRILFVDDDTNLLSGIERAMRKEPYQILVANSGAAALQIMAETEIDVVVSDHDMAGLTGTAFLRQVREQFPETVRFMLTGKATLDVAINAINEGEITRFFQKPCNMLDLLVSIREGVLHRSLLLKIRELMELGRSQRERILRLEEQYPGISHVRRDAMGEILLDDSKLDFNSFLRSLNQHRR